MLEIKEKQITDILNKSYQYDNRGNLTEVTQNDQLLQRYEFNPSNQLTKIVNPNGEVTTHQYNGLGYRIESMTPSGDINYVTDFTKAYHNLLMQKTKDGSQHFVWDGNVVSTGNETETDYYLQDELGSPIRFLDDAGAPIDTYGYDEFGQSLFVKNSDVNAQRKQATIQQPFGYTGYRTDKENKLYYANARYYIPEAGRFSSRDIDTFIRIDDTKTLNQYSYCQMNPLTNIDPTGYDIEDNNIEVNKLDLGSYIASINDIPITTNNSLFFKEYMDQYMEYLPKTEEPEKDNLNNFTISLKYGVSAVCILGIACDIGVSVDGKGNYAIQCSYAIPSVNDTALVGTLGASKGWKALFTSQETVYDLVEKNSESVGATILSAVVDLVYIESMEEPNALQLSYGSAPFPDVHIEQGKTFNIVSGKISELPDKIKSVINNGEISEIPNNLIKSIIEGVKDGKQ